MSDVSARSMKVKVRCPGKVILFGEHASVYGYPSLVTTVSAYTQVEIEQLIEPVIRYEAPAFDFKLECKVTLFDDVTAIKDEVTERQACEQIRHILSQKQSVTEESWFLLLYFYHKIVPLSDRFGIKVTATTQLWPGAGMGSSASYCCSLALALLTLCDGDSSIANVNRISYQGEKVFHGTPSGVDNTACSFGGCLVYNKTGQKDFSPVPAKTTPRLLVINSRQPHNTAEIVGQVRQQRHKLTSTFKRIGEITREGEELLRAGKDISGLITENHNLLNKLPGVSNTHTDRIVEICRDYGVPAKITGAGGGGVVIGIIPADCANLSELISSLKTAGYQVLTSLKTGVTGVELVEEREGVEATV